MRSLKPTILSGTKYSSVLTPPIPAMGVMLAMGLAGGVGGGAALADTPSFWLMAAAA